MLGDFHPGRSYNISVTNASSTQAATPVATGVRMVRLITTIACYVALDGDAAVGGSTSFAMAPAFPEYVAVGPGTKIAVIGTTTTGTLSVTEC